MQRIFYIHPGSFLGSFISFSVALVAGIEHLRSRDARWDTLGLSSIEIGLVFSTITIVTGMAWARPIWNTWWTWDPRLTSVTIMWLAYAAYMMLRAGIEDPERKRRFAAVYGIIAFASVMFTIIIIRVRPDTIHPVVVGPTQADLTGAFEVSRGCVMPLFQPVHLRRDHRHADLVPHPAEPWTPSPAGRCACCRDVGRKDPFPMGKNAEYMLLATLRWR